MLAALAVAACVIACILLFWGLASYSASVTRAIERGDLDNSSTLW